MHVTAALVMQQAKRMRPIILSSVAFLAVPSFSTLSQTARFLKKKVTEHKICALIFSTTSV
jgi:hypothetical protein